MTALKKKLLFNSSASIVRLLIAVALLGSLAWFATVQYAKARTVTYVIPAGTSRQLASGEETVSFPNELTLTVGDTIVIDNQDDAVHAFGPFTILPHTTLSKRFETVRVYENACTFHQDRQMRLVINPASWDIFQ